MDDLQKQLSGSRVEDKDGAVNRFSRQVSFKRLKYNSSQLKLTFTEEIATFVNCLNLLLHFFSTKVRIRAGVDIVKV